MTKDEETYLFISQSIGILDDSLNVLSSLKGNENIKSVIFNAAFRYALIEYSKPFSTTNGLFLNDNNKPIRIKYEVTKFVPLEYLELHKRVLDSRNQFHAHADMTVFDPKLYIQDNKDNKIVVISKNNVHGCQEFKDIDNIVDMILKILENMEIELVVLEGSMPQNCTFLEPI